jgi:hypothetical protein
MALEYILILTEYYCVVCFSCVFCLAYVCVCVCFLIILTCFIFSCLLTDVGSLKHCVYVCMY